MELYNSVGYANFYMLGNPTYIFKQYPIDIGNIISWNTETNYGTNIGTITLQDNFNTFFPNAQLIELTVGRLQLQLVKENYLQLKIRHQMSYLERIIIKHRILD